MSEYPIHTHFPGRLIFIGFGSIGQGVLPLILRHVGGLAAERITIVTADDAGREEAGRYGIKFINHPLTRENFRHV
jgi:homospermidine synthase